jgi:hypothetical protein
MLTIERLKDLLHYDPETGIFTWKVARSGTSIGQIAGSTNGDGYDQTQIDSVAHKNHRLAWFYMTGEWPEHTIDHIDCDRRNNRFANLRHATRVENMQNQRTAHSNNSSGFLGVSPFRGKFVAHIKVNGKRIYLGEFKDPKTAHDAYLTAKRNLHSFCTL